MAQRSCCVPGCSMKLGGGLPLHRFPNPNNPAQIEHFRTWVMKIGGVHVGERRHIERPSTPIQMATASSTRPMPMDTDLSSRPVMNIELPSTSVQIKTASSTTPVQMDTDISSRPGKS